MSFHFFITGTYFGNDEVKKDDTCHHNDGEPDEPEDDVLEVVQLGGSIKVKITQRNTCDGENVCKQIR